MTKKIIRFIVILIIMFMINSFCYKIYAADTVDDVMQGAQDFLDMGKGSNIDKKELKTISDFIFNFLLAIAMIVAVIVGMILGVKFMTSSIDEKAKIKEALVPYVVSCVVIFGAFGIWKLAVTILSRW